MSKSKNKALSELQSQEDQFLDRINESDSPELWDLADPSDQVFWEEFFQIDEILEMTDELDPPNFTISVQNHRTGEVKTFSHIHLQSTKKKIVC